MIISKSQAAIETSVTRQMIEKWQAENPQPDFFVLVNNKYKIDTEKQSWINRKELMNETRLLRSVRNKKNSEAKKGNGVDYSLPPEMSDLSSKAAIADLEKTIHESKIKEEHAKQQEIKTFEIKRDLAPMYMMKHFFSFTEKIIQRLYRKPHDIEPQLAALYMAGQNKSATALLIRELESIVKEVQKELITEMEKEGYKIQAENKDGSK